MNRKSKKDGGGAMFRGLLVPVDFSKSSARALRHAAELAAKSGGSLVIVHVVPVDYGWLGIGRDESRDLDRSLQRQAADRLRAFADENVGHRVAAELEVRIGRPAEEIVAAATEAKSDAIVLSTRGITGLDRYFIGSVADRVARLAACPVFLIPPGRPALSRAPTSPPVLRLKHESKGCR
jgi:nucleotide-binding universal stress UspA family protein